MPEHMHTRAVKSFQAQQASQERSLDLKILRRLNSVFYSWRANISAHYEAFSIKIYRIITSSVLQNIDYDQAMEPEGMQEALIHVADTGAMRR